MPNRGNAAEKEAAVTSASLNKYPLIKAGPHRGADTLDLDSLVRNIPDAQLRFAITREVAKLKANKKFGLVFEEHAPEVVQLPNFPVQRDATVVKRGDKKSEIFRVIGPAGGSKFRITREASEDEETVSAKELVVIKKFGESIYPTLTSIDRVTRGDDKPYHTIINADNFHALQLLLYCYEGQVDVIYIDPPYNTGARDWKYNNDYVDSTDPWKHSKWLSFVDKRLRLAKKLLKPNGVLVVTIDEHEIHHLGCLLEQVFPNARRQMITIVNNAAGVSQGGFYRVEEYAFFCFLGNAKPNSGSDDFLSDDGKAKVTPLWFSLIRYGGINALPSKRPGLVYPIAIDPKRSRIVALGKTLKQLVDNKELAGDLNEWRPNPNEKLNGFPVIWPFREDGSLSTWQLKPEKLIDLLKDGFVKVRIQDNGPGGNKYSVSYIKSANRSKIRSGAISVLGREADNGALILGKAKRNIIPKTVWKRVRHDAGKWGSRTIREILGNVSFDYAKSPYAVFDTLSSVVGNRRDALILDFFAGSGTTLHATALMNADDDGRRRCILITNNEVGEKAAKQLYKRSYWPGDQEFERHGICESVTWPRCKYAVNGKRDDGTELSGTYLNGRAMKDGFAENVEYFKLDFLDPHEVAYGEKFEAILPILWLMAGAQGERDKAARGYGKWFIPESSPYAVLIKEDHFAEFKRKIKQRRDITHVFLVTDSEEAFREMIAELPGSLKTKMLYKSYLDNFRINTGENL